MSDTVLFLSRPASEALALIHASKSNGKRAQPVWLLLLTALFAAAAALTCATVVILGAPGAAGGSVDVGGAKGGPVRILIASPSR